MSGVESLSRWDELCRSFSKETKVTLEEPLAKKTTLRLGGNARYYIEPANEDDLARIVKYSKEEDLKLFMLGRGSNLVVLDSGFDGIVVHLKHPNWRAIQAIDANRFYAGAGVRLKEICGYALKEGLGGFEFLEGIPGSLGGSLRMNAGAMGGWLFDVIESVRYMTGDGEIIEARSEDLELGYRYCRELQDAMAIGATLLGKYRATSEEIRERIQSNSGTRKKSQPREPSAGCIFKNPEGNIAGKLIEESGLKGVSVGNAQVSDIHANFIINKGNARSEDVINLVKKVREEVFRKTKINLEPEVLLLGAQWKDILNR